MLVIIIVVFNSGGGSTTSTASTTPGPTFPPGEVCGVLDADKRSCVVFSPEQAECENYGCCYKQVDGVSPERWCYENNGKSCLKSICIIQSIYHSCCTLHNFSHLWCYIYSHNTEHFTDDFSFSG